MAIEGTISAVTVIKSGDCLCGFDCQNNPYDPSGVCPACHGATEESPVVRIALESHCGASTGQTALTIVNPPTTDIDILSGLIGTFIWGGSDSIMIGDKKWADRLSYTRIKLV